jgi:hypothetical protein
VSVCACGTEVDLVPLANGGRVQVELERVPTPEPGLLFRLDFGDGAPFYSRLTEANLDSHHRGPYRRPHAPSCTGVAA